MNEPLSATETLARGKAAALYEVYRLIDLNAARGSVTIPSYAGEIKAHVWTALEAKGFKVERNPGGDDVSWINVKE